MLKSWMVIAAVTFAVALASSLFRPKDVKWFNRQQRPQWLTFERLIPVIWTVIFICGGWSAYIIWERHPDTSNTWFLMAAYLLLEVVTIAYTPATLWFQSLRVGTYVGATGFILALILVLLIIPVSGWAALLLMPYLLWSPIGTYTTWQMDRLNSNT